MKQDSTTAVPIHRDAESEYLASSSYHTSNPVWFTPPNHTSGPPSLIPRIPQDPRFTSDRFMDELYIVRYVSLPIFLCQLCTITTAVPPDQLLAHLHTHEMYPKYSQAEVLSLAAKYGVPARSIDVPFPPIIDPIPGIPTRDGFQCLLCVWSTTSAERIGKHIGHHKRDGIVAQYEKCIVQKVFHQDQKYRRVTSHSLPPIESILPNTDAELAMATHLLQPIMHAQKIMQLPHDFDDLPVYVSQLFLAEHVHGLSPHLLTSLIQVPQKDEKHLLGIRQALDAYFAWLTPIIRSDRYTLVLRHINTCNANG